MIRLSRWCCIEVVGKERRKKGGMGKGNGTERENNERPGRRGSRGKGSEEGKEVSLVVGAWATTVTDVLTAAASTARPCMQAGTAAASCQCIHSDTCPPMHAKSR